MTTIDISLFVGLIKSEMAIGKDFPLYINGLRKSMILSIILKRGFQLDIEGEIIAEDERIVFKRIFEFSR